MTILWIFVVHWYTSLFFQTFFLHRYVSHGMFKMSKSTERIFFVLTFIFQGSSFLNPRAYGILHRLHHAHSDTIDDPHSPAQTGNIIRMNFVTFSRYWSILKGDANHGEYEKGIPKWERFEKFTNKFLIRVLFIGLYVGLYATFATTAWQYLLLPIHIFMGPIHGSIVNWFGHKAGYRNYDSIKDNSKNTLPIDLLMMGELYQNNHHKEPTSPNFGKRWFEIDIGYLLYRMLKMIKVVY